MQPWRRTAASVVTASAVLLTGQTAAVTAAPVPASQTAEQGFRAAAQLAADAYREQRRRILLRYRDATRSAHHRLRLALLDATTPAEREAAWRAYAEQTAPLRADAHRAMQEARATFRSSVEAARSQFAMDTAPTASLRMR